MKMAGGCDRAAADRGTCCACASAARRVPARPRSRAWRKLKTSSSIAAVVEVVAADGSSGIVERVGCRVADAPGQLTWSLVWSHALRAEPTHDPAGAIGRDATVTYTHRTVAGALREARLTTLA